MPEESRCLGQRNTALTTILAKSTGKLKYHTPCRTIRLPLEPVKDLSKSTGGSRIIGWEDFRPKGNKGESYPRFFMHLAFAAAAAIATECVVGSMGGDHESATNERNENLRCVGWQAISPPGAAEDEA